MNSNIKQHMNENKMALKPEIKQKIGDVLSLDPTSLESFCSMLEKPDAVFDAIYPAYKRQLNDIFENPESQRQLISQLKMNPIDDLALLKAELPMFINEITDDEGLSENKKDLIATIFTSSLSIIEQIIEGGGREFIPVKIVKTGIAVAIPAGYEIQVRPRSGLSLKSGLRIANAPGTIDTDYRGEIGIIMTNTKDIPYVIEKGMKIAQLVISQVPRIRWDEVATVEDLGTTERGEGGFGSTGVKS